MLSCSVWPAWCGGSQLQGQVLQGRVLIAVLLFDGGDEHLLLFFDFGAGAGQGDVGFDLCQ